MGSVHVECSEGAEVGSVASISRIWFGNLESRNQIQLGSSSDIRTSAPGTNIFKRNADKKQ